MSLAAAAASPQPDRVAARAAQGRQHLEIRARGEIREDCVAAQPDPERKLLHVSFDPRPRIVARRALASAMAASPIAQHVIDAADHDRHEHQGAEQHDHPGGRKFELLPAR